MRKSPTWKRATTPGDAAVRKAPSTGLWMSRACMLFLAFYAIMTSYLLDYPDVLRDCGVVLVRDGSNTALDVLRTTGHYCPYLNLE